MALSDTAAAPQPEQAFDPIDLPHSTKLLILGAVMLGLFLSALDQTIVSTALPAIVADFQGIGMVSWISTGYLLASTATVPIYGKLSDIYGRKAILLWGIIVFLIGSILCGISGSMIQLIVYRVVQGIGAAAISSTAFATPADLFAPADRPKYMGLFGGVFGLSSVIGPFLGGILTDKLSWHWVFYVNIPLGLIALAFIYLKMPWIRSGQRPKIDWLGTVLLILAVVPFMLGLSLDKTIHAWGSPLIIGMFVVSIISLIAFLMVEMRVSSPVLSLNLFRNQTFAIGVLVSMLNGAAFFGAVLFLSLYLVNVLGLTATEAGVTQIPLMVGFVLSSNLCSWLVQRTGRYKGFIIGGFVVMLLGFGLMSRLTPNTAVADVAWRVFVLGLGLGPSMPLLNLAVQNAASRRELGAVTANRQFFQQLGQALGGAVFGVVLISSLSHQLQTRFAPIQQQVSAAVLPAIDPAQFRNVSVAEHASVEAIDVGQQLAQAVTASLEIQRQLLSQALGEQNAQALQQLRDDTSLAPELRQLLDDPQASSEQANSIINQLEQQASQEAQAIGPQVDLAVKQSFTSSITNIYLYSFGLGLIAMLLVIFGLPELPLARNVKSEVPVMHD
jgi:EmrB/QacA subfamily drug resistance transporter